MILNIPIPTIFISSDYDVDDSTIDDSNVARYSVIDGQQRLTAIRDFFNDSFALTELDLLPELEGMRYSNLPPFLTRRLEDRSIKCQRIDSFLEPQVKYDIFERLNTSSVELTAQELRNAVCRGNFNRLIKILANNKDFISITSFSKDKKKRMENYEAILRFFALGYNDGYREYKSDLSSFLTSKMKKFDSYSKEELENMQNLFEEVMKTIHSKFGQYPYSRHAYDSDGKYVKQMSKFSIATYDAVNVAFCHAIQNNIDLSNCTYSKFKELFRIEEFANSTASSTSSKKRVEYRIHEAIRVICNEHAS